MCCNGLEQQVTEFNVRIYTGWTVGGITKCVDLVLGLQPESCPVLFPNHVPGGSGGTCNCTRALPMCLSSP